MFEAASNLLALIAFIVHAVFGCCVHHHHHAFEYACVAVDAPKLWCHDHASESHDVEAEHKDCSDKDENRSADSPEVPCDGSHDCNEPSCSFIAASSNSLTDIRVLSPIVICFGDTITLAPLACVSYAKASRHFELAGPPASLSLRLALRNLGKSDCPSDRLSLGHCDPRGFAFGLLPILSDQIYRNL